MNDLRLKINSTDLKDEQSFKSIISEIENIIDDDEMLKYMNYLIKKIRVQLLEESLNYLFTEDEVCEKINDVKEFLEANTDLTSYEIDKLFDKEEIKPKKIMKDVLYVADAEIDMIERNFSKELGKSNIKIFPSVEDLEKQIKEYEEEKSEQVKAHNELISAITKEIEEREQSSEEIKPEKINIELEEIQKERNQLWEKFTKKREEYNKNDKVRFEELDKRMRVLQKKLKKYQDIDNILFSIENNKLKILRKEQKKLIDEILASNAEISEKDKAKFDTFDKLIKESEAKIRSIKTNTVGGMNSEDLKKLLEEYTNKQKNIQSNYDKKIENLNVQLKQVKRLEDLKEYQKNKGNKQKIEKIEKAKKLALKSLIAIGGFGTGLVLSSVPGVGTIRMIAATTKLTASAINLWTKKFPEGKVTKLINTTQTKLGEKISSFQEKCPKIASTAKIVKNKIKQVLENKNVNLFINGLSAGYVVGNAIELFTGKTVIEHFSNAFDNDSATVVNKTTEWNSGNTEPTIPEESGNVEVTIPDEPGNIDVTTPSIEEVVPEIESIDIPSPEITLKPGVTYDLSGISEGFVSSTAEQPVGLMTSVADDLTFDRIVNGRAHFIQANGQGMAWYDLEEVKDYLSKTMEISSKVGRIK